MERKYYFPQVSDERKVPGCCICLMLATLTIITICAIPMIFQGINNEEVPQILREAVPELEISEAFEAFKNDYNRKYNNEDEEKQRKAIFSENYRSIVAYNKMKYNFKLGVNKFADMTLAEFKKNYLAKPEKVHLLEVDWFAPVKTVDNETVDWEALGKTSPIRDQGNCGSCWTFSSIAATESLYAIKANTKPVALSEQMLVDCCKTSLSDGCNGGERWQAFEYITENGIAERVDYPYKARNEICKEREVKKFMKLNHYHNITKGSPSEMAEAVKTRPVSIGLNASPFAFMFYKEGILDRGCPSDEINHGVVIVGYGIDEATKLPYWKVRNSWSKGWGKDGHIYIKRDLENGPGLCAINMKGCMPKYPGEN